MMTSNMRAIGTLAIALTVVAMAGLARAQNQAESSTPPAAPPEQSTIAKPAVPLVPVTSQPASGTNQVPAGISSAAAAVTAPLQNSSALNKPGLRQEVSNVLKKLDPERMRMDQEYQKAAGIFPTFCKDWERKLRDRESNNIQHLVWKLENGLETALYTGYSNIESCEVHQSSQGFSIGTITYEEYHYLLKGKTPDEAIHAKGSPADDTRTKEIFRWEKGKWFY